MVQEILRKIDIYTAIATKQHNITPSHMSSMLRHKLAMYSV